MFNPIPSAGDLTFLILAGGRGTRLKSVVADRPKVLAEVNGRPYIYFLLDFIKKAGGKKIVICTGYKAGDVEKCLRDQYNDELNLIFSRELIPLGTGGALRLGFEKISSEYVVVMNGDSYINCNLSEYICWFFKNNYKISLLLSKTDDVSRYGSVSVNAQNEITYFSEKRTSNGAGLINAGVYIMKESIISMIPNKTFYSLENDFFPKLIGSTIHGFITRGEFIDIGTPESYNHADLFFKDLL